MSSLTNFFTGTNSPPASIASIGSPTEFLKDWRFALLLVFIVFVAMVVYHETIGYYMKFGWDRVKEMIGFGTKVDIGMGPGAVEEPVLTATLQPYDAPPTSPLPPVSDRPSGMPGASESESEPSLLSAMSASAHGALDMKEVYNVSKNIYTFHDAAAVCAANDGELATYEQVKDAHEKGADWCNYGWVKGQMAVYPTQKATYEKLQKAAPEFRNACGKPGVNGGHFDNPDLRFGVNCYGVKPAKKASDELLESMVALPASPAEIEFEKQVQKFRDQMDNTSILPFRKGQWSE
jgi:hypothetical protein